MTFSRLIIDLKSRALSRLKPKQRLSVAVQTMDFSP
jgi:hypothetical protein